MTFLCEGTGSVLGNFTPMQRSSPVWTSLSLQRCSSSWRHYMGCFNISRRMWCVMLSFWHPLSRCYLPLAQSGLVIIQQLLYWSSQCCQIIVNCVLLISTPPLSCMYSGRKESSLPFFVSPREYASMHLSDRLSLSRS